ncbi:MAG TPA: hypothetical protein VK712_02350 [Verrucomicrobiae bacterium]|jgi:hypothetical protein|nr:hypothetical protein [Verrucomicrobiae bacterium]
MAVAEHPVETITLGDTLGGFEEATTAAVAVSKVLGNDYPSLLETADGTTLLEQTQTTEDPGTVTFAGPAAAAIRMALGVVAEDTTSLYRLPARRMLGIPVESERRQAPKSQGGVVEEHLKLSTFGGLVAAFKSVEIFAEEAEQAVVLGTIKSDFENIPTGESRAFFYLGDEAQIIYRSLVKAALRGSSYYDLVAAHILGSADYGSPALDAAKNISLS